MSKTVSGQDVEDMLSSVRRLVSSELPPHRRTSRAPDGEKLVLTDAQRIEPAKRAERPRSMRLEDRIAELEAAVSKTTDDWEPDGSEDQSQHRPDRIVYTPPEPRLTTRRISRITLLETPRKTEDAEEDASARDLSAAEVEALTRETATEAVSEVLSEHSAFDAALKEAVSDSLKETKPQAAAPAPAPETEPEPEPEAEPAPEPEARTASPLPLPPEARSPVPKAERFADAKPAPTAAPIDKEALRPLVNRLLREELQGEIGERITRNVRKLVRQEIQRALAMQDLD